MSAHPELLVVHKFVQTLSEIIHAAVIRVTPWTKTDDRVTILMNVRWEHLVAPSFAQTESEITLVGVI